MASSVQNEKQFCDQVQQYIADNGKLSIFIVGHLGSGKSTLVNSLLGWNAATAGYSLEAVTTDVDNFDGLVRMQRPIGNISVTIWDSPGLQDPDSRGSVLRNIEDKCKDVDLVVYCVQMTKTRFDAGEAESICDITKALGVSMWEKAMFALTFANNLELPVECDGKYDLQDYYFQTKKKWSHLLRKHLKDKAHVGVDVADGVPVITAGYGREPLFYLRENGDWYQEFWLTCCETVLFDSLPFLLVIMHHFKQNEKNAELFSDIIAQKHQKVIEGQGSSSTFSSILRFGAEGLGLGYCALGQLLLRNVHQTFQPSEKLLSQEEFKII